MTSENSVNNSDFTYVDSDQQLDGLIQELNGVRSLALDMEADSFHHYRPKVCLIQISFHDATYIVDPLAPVNIGRLLNELADKELIIHDTGYDLRLLSADFDFRPNRAIYDTKLAAALASMEKVGLSDVLHHVTGIKVTKQNQRANWSKRPLPDHLLKYAAEDTSSLIEIKEYLANQLAKLGRTDWHTESCAAAVSAAYATKDPIDKNVEWRIKGSGKLSFKEMAYLREIWYWREKIASQTNIAPFMICRNEDMTKLAIWAAKRRKPVSNETKLPIRIKTQYQRPVLESLQKAQSLPADQWPGPRKNDSSKRLSEKKRKIVNTLKTECEKIADKHNLPLNLIASRSALTRIVTGHVVTMKQIQDKQILLNWQATLILPAIEKVLKSS